MQTVHARLALTAAIVVLACGCYTQIATVNRTPPAEPRQPCPDSLQDSCDQAEARNAAKDTVVIRDDRHQVCYWSRNWWGEPVLRCYRTYYPDVWVSYYSDPWWYDRYDYGPYGYRSCPPYYYYDPYTGYCRYGRDYNTYYHRPRSGYGSGSTSGAVTRKPIPRPTDEPTPAPAEAPAPLPKETVTGGLAPYYPGGSSRNAPATPTSPSPAPVRTAPNPSSSPAPAPATAPSATVTKESAPRPAEAPQAVTPAVSPVKETAVQASEGQGSNLGEVKESKPIERRPKRRELEQ